MTSTSYPCLIFAHRAVELLCLGNQICSDSLHNTVRLARVDFLARLLDLLQHGLVVEGVFGHDLGGLGLEAHVVGFDACARDSESAEVDWGEVMGS